MQTKQQQSYTHPMSQGGFRLVLTGRNPSEGSTGMSPLHRTASS